MRFTRKIFIPALLAGLLGGAAAYAAEFEVLDRFSVDGYTVLRGSADIPGGSFAVGGSAFVVSGGNVGIGTTAPGYGLEVINAAGAHLSTTATAGYGFYLNTSGNVGIGAAGSGKKLFVQTNTAWDGILINDGVNDKGFIVNNNSGGTQLGLNTGATRKVTIDTDGNSYFSGGSVGIGATAPQGKLNISNNGAEGLEVYPGNASGVDALQFYNRSSSSYDAVRLIANSYRFEINGTEKVRLDSSGNVGIGTTGPAAKLEVYDGSPTGGSLRIGNSGGAGYSAGVDFYTGSSPALRGFVGWRNTSSAAPFNTATGVYLFNTDNSNLIFGTNNQEKMRIDVNGNVGIGTTAPSAGLDLQKAQTAAGGVARGANLAQVLTASANNDVLTGLKIAPTFANGAYTGVQNYGLHVDGDIRLTNNKAFSVNQQTDATERDISTAWTDGKEWTAISCPAYGKLMIWIYIPCRNDSASWGGGYHELQYRINGGSYVSLGNSGYTSVMTLSTGDIGFYHNTFYLNPGQTADYTIQFKNRHRSYDGTLWINKNTTYSGADYATKIIVMILP